MITSTAAEKAFDKVKHPFMIFKNINKVDIEDIKKTIYDKPTADINSMVKR